MTMVSCAQAVAVINPSDSLYRPWDFAVPAGNENVTFNSHRLSNEPAWRTCSSRLPHGARPDGRPRLPQQRANTSNLVLSAKSVCGDAAARKPSGQSEPARGPDMHRNGGTRRAASALQIDGPDDIERNSSYWVHYDKLAQIERDELEQAGLLPRSTTSSTGRDRPRYIPVDQPDERRRSNAVTDWRVPDEVGPTRGYTSTRKDTSRTGTSRIPVPKHPTAPVAIETTGRDATRPRSRSGSQLHAPAHGRRRVSVGSQVLLDDASDQASSNEADTAPRKTTLTNGSLNKARMPTSKAPTSGKRTHSKSRASSQGSKSRSSSAATQNARPRTASRPMTARPEGEPPWIATMFKPDPMLPPDQQILPTHAKRIAQERWEREGKVGNMYSKDFKQLNEGEFAPHGLFGDSLSAGLQSPPSQQPQAPEAEYVDPDSDEVKDGTGEREGVAGTRDDEGHRTSQADDNYSLEVLSAVEPNARIQTATIAEHARYKITPKVPIPAVGPCFAPTIPDQHTTQPQQTMVHTDPGEKVAGKPKQNACCCVVM